MARKKDSEDDKQARLILSQLNSKTVGPPLSTTGLTGDQAPDTIFTVDDFDKIRNQINLQLSNVEALNLLNSIGQISNTQGYGPLPGTGRIEELVSESSGIQTIFRPKLGEVYQMTAASTGSAVNATIILHLYDGTTKVELGQETGVNVVFNPFTMGVVYVDNNVYLAADYSSNSGETRCVASFIRVR